MITQASIEDLKLFRVAPTAMRQPRRANVKLSPLEANGTGRNGNRDPGDLQTDANRAQEVELSSRILNSRESRCPYTGAHRPDAYRIRRDGPTPFLSIIIKKNGAGQLPVLTALNSISRSQNRQ